MDIKFKTLFASCAIVSLAACGSSNNTTGSGGGGGGSFQNKVDLEALQAATTFTRTPEANLPSSGSIQYEGFVQIADVNNNVSAIAGTEAVGTASFAVGFDGTGSLTGSATNFQDQAGTYTGTLTFGNGSVAQDPSESNQTVVRGELDGTLTRDSGEDITVDGNVVGRFFGDNADHIVGSSNQATATVNGTAGNVEIAIHGARR